MAVFSIRQSVRKQVAERANAGIGSGILLVIGAASIIGSLPNLAKKAQDIFLFGLVAFGVGIVLLFVMAAHERMARIEEFEHRQVEILQQIMDLAEGRDQS